MSTKRGILERVIEPGQGDLPVEVANYILTLGFSAADQAKYAELADKAQDGALSPDERAELEEFLDVDDFLAMAQSKARMSLKKRGSASR